MWAQIQDKYQHKSIIKNFFSFFFSFSYRTGVVIKWEPFEIFDFVFSFIALFYQNPKKGKLRKTDEDAAVQGLR